MQSVQTRSALLLAALLVLFFGSWQLLTIPTRGTGPAMDPAYAALVARVSDAMGRARAT